MRKSHPVARSLVSFVAGLLFAFGLGISGMTQPQKVIGFLNPWNWDPSLIFVMVGAILVHSLSYALVRRRQSPLLDHHWHVPTRRDLSMRLILGSAIFGAGWGLGGFCPGPGMASLITGDERVIAFVVAMAAGMYTFIWTENLLPLKK